MRYLAIALVVVPFAGCCFPARLTTPAGTQDINAICQNRWWRKKPTPALVAQWANAMVNANQGSVFVVDSDCNALVIPNESITFRQDDGRPILFPFPEKIDHSRHLYIDLNDSLRPSRETILTELKFAVQNAEYRHGPP